MSWGDLSAMNTGVQSEVKRLLEERIAAEVRAQQLKQQEFQNARLTEGDKRDQQRLDADIESNRLTREQAEATRREARTERERTNVEQNRERTTPFQMLFDANPKQGAMLDSFDKFGIQAGVEIPKVQPRLYTSMNGTANTQAAPTNERAAVYMTPTNAQDEKLRDDRMQRDQFDRQVKADKHRVEHDTEMERLAANRQNAGAGLSPEALDLVARSFLTNGQLPSLGMGASGARIGAINRAAQIDPSANVASNSAGFQADKASLTSMQKMRDAVGAFEATANRNADNMMVIAKKLTDTRSPLLNRPVRELEARFGGDPDVAAFNAARRVVVNEYARIVSNPNLAGVLSDSARTEMDSVLSGDATIPQMVAIVNMLKQDAASRKVSLDEGLQGVRGRIGGTGATTAPPASSGAPKPTAADLIKKYGAGR